jgi:pyruvate dehydrogenase E2 component (dihydrolipoamide acetyltransferase)
MTTTIDMPKLSDTMTVGTVANWLKNEGDSIESGDIIAEIETDKATMELEVFDEGVLLKQIVPVGGQVPVGAPIAAVGEAGETFDSSSLPAADVPAETEAVETEEAAEEPETAAAAEAEPTAEAPSEKTPQGDGPAIKASPLAKKLAAQNGIDLANVTGSGPNGRIVKNDVLAANPAAAKSTPAKKPAAAPTTSAIISAGIAEEKDLPVSKMRAVIAKRLLQSKTTAPHFYLETEVDVGALLELRKQLNSELSELSPEQGGVKFSVNDFILKAATESLRRVPEMNRSWNESTIRQHSAVNISFGVAIDDGLLTPVIRDADAKGLKAIALEAKELIGKSRSNKLTPNEMSGSTFTVTNLGMFGVTGFYGIINTPNAGILSVGATVARPVIDANGEFAIGQIMRIGLSCDHRVVDGVVGAQFLQALKIIIEKPALILV